jgi:hypothetical protein
MVLKFLYRGSSRATTQAEMITVSESDNPLDTSYRFTFDGVKGLRRDKLR